jgi:hypothetical protein
MAGTTGANITPVGIPDDDSFEIAANRAAGPEARGSMRRFRSSSSVVRLTNTRTSCSAASVFRMSRSRTTRADLVTIVTGWCASVSTSRIERVMPIFFSSGW